VNNRIRESQGVPEGLSIACEYTKEVMRNRGVLRRRDVPSEYKRREKEAI